MALVVVLLAALGISAYFIGRDLGLPGFTRSAVVPSVTRDHPSAARSRLERAGFHHLHELYLTSRSVPAGEVIGTQPTTGTRLRLDHAVAIEVSKGRPTVNLPNVTGDTQAKATQVMESDGFVVRKSFTSSASVHQGVVVRTRPVGPAREPEGSRVVLVISTGPQLVTVPNVSLDNQTAATDQLHNKGFEVNPTPVTVTSSVKVGDVVRTSPAAGRSVPLGRTITLYVSGGPAQTTIPYLVGDTASQAKTVLESDHLGVAFANQTVSSSSQGGLVQQSSPPAGVSEPPGTIVTVYRGVYSQATSGTSGVTGGSGTSGTSGSSGTSGTGPVSGTSGTSGDPTKG
jgi:serine/threonine-protein kinase